MNTLLRTGVLVVAMILSTHVIAEGKSRGGNEFRHTASKYDAKAAKYRAKGMNDVAELYARQAEIKRSAAELGDENRWNEIDWSEYHENEKQINEKVRQAKKTTHKKKKKNKKGGDEFRHAASKYDTKAEKYRTKGMNDVADLYDRQAEIKRNAAEMGDDNRWNEIDWTEYHENESLIKAKTQHLKKNKYKEKAASKTK